jgi:Mrp family chromosome partitioning ATPase
MLESLESGYTGIDQVERLLGVSVLGVVPAVRRLRGARTPETLVLEQPASQFCESLRGLYTSLLLSEGAAPPKVVLVASAQSKEGKSSTALALGRLMAHCGKRIAIVDCDLQAGRLRKACEVPSSPGLVEFLDGAATLEEIIYPDLLSPASVIPVGLTRHVSPDLIGSQRRF